jgi:uncharacterized protein
VKTKLAQLKSLLNDLGSVLVAYSGGVDSTLLASLSHEILGERSLAVTARSPIFKPVEISQAESLALRLGLRYVIIDTNQLEDPSFVANDPQRCYYCKRALCQQLINIANEKGLAFVLDGTNYDDLDDFRPGRKAAVELGVRSPLLEVGLTKEEIRALSRNMGLHNWEKPSSPCLATRLPHGTPITLDLLTLIDKAEQSLAKLGLTQFRVRHHGPIARIEASPNDMPLFAHEKTRLRVIAELYDLGYTYVTLDLAGYRPGGRNSLHLDSASMPL